MSSEVGGGSRTLKSINTLITTTLVCVVLGSIAWVAAYLLSLTVLYAVAGLLAIVAVVPLFLMFGRVRSVEADIGHREALSLAQRKETERNQQAILRLLDELAPPTPLSAAASCTAASAATLCLSRSRSKRR
jgi:hypothetical protein